jgi:hypothetical protein
VMLPRVRAVMFGRCAMPILMRAAATLMLWPLLAIEDVIKELPDVLRPLATHYAEKHELGDHRTLCVAEIYLAGWCPKERRMRLWTLNNYEDFVPRENVDAVGLRVAPGLGRAGELSGKTREEQLVALLEAERIGFAAHPEAMLGSTVGGEVHAVCVTPTVMEHRILHRFDNYDALLAEGTANAARLRSGEYVPAVRDGIVPVDDFKRVA